MQRRFTFPHILFYRQQTRSSQFYKQARSSQFYKAVGRNLDFTAVSVSSYLPTKKPKNICQNKISSKSWRSQDLISLSLSTYPPKILKSPHNRSFGCDKFVDERCCMNSIIIRINRVMTMTNLPSSSMCVQLRTKHSDTGGWQPHLVEVISTIIVIMTS